MFSPKSCFQDFIAKNCQQQQWKAIMNTGSIPAPLCLQQHKTKWTPDEDLKLKNAVEQLGTESWIRVALLVPGRNSKQCRERWMGQLSPNIVKSNWSAEEDQLLIQQHSIIGNKWTLIASLLPGRSAINVKNRWSRLKRHQPPSTPSLQIASDTNSIPSKKSHKNKVTKHSSYGDFPKTSNEISLSPSVRSQSPTIVLLPNQPNIMFEFPKTGGALFGADFTRFQEQMLM